MQQQVRFLAPFVTCPSRAPTSASLVCPFNLLPSTGGNRQRLQALQAYLCLLQRGARAAFDNECLLSDTERTSLRRIHTMRDPTGKFTLLPPSLSALLPRLLSYTPTQKHA